MRVVDRFLKRNRLEVLLLLPLLLYFLAFVAFPFLYNLFLSFNSTSGGLALTAYREVLSDPRFGSAVVNTLVISAVSLALELLLGLGLAMWIFKARGRWARVWRLVFILPLGVPGIVSAANMRYIFDVHGYLNGILQRIGVLNGPVDWMGGGWISLLAIAVADTWKVTPLVMLILLAGLKSIPKDLYDSARIDGADAWQEFFYITLPLLRRFLTMAIIVRGIDAFRIFELPLALAGGNIPVLSTYAYFEYAQYDSPATSAVAGLLLAVMVLLFVWGYIRVMGDGD